MTSSRPRILLIGTGDTKADELLFMQERIKDAGGTPVMMDISVLGDPPYEAQLRQACSGRLSGHHDRRRHRQRR